MNSSPQSNPARAHHFLPRFYLRGFAAKVDKHRVWVYERGKKYKESRVPEMRNPLLQPIKKAGMQVDLYAATRDDGTVDYDGFEKRLSARDSDDAKLLQKLINGKMLGRAEKYAFARFVVLMHKRSPHRQAKAQETARELVRDSLFSMPMLDTLDTMRGALRHSQIQWHTQISALESEFERIMRNYSIEPPSHLRLEAMMAQYATSIGFLSDMNWHILQAPEERGFLASDVPVFFSHGLKNSRAEVLFPLDHAHLFAATWKGPVGIHYEKTSAKQVEEANRILAFQTQSRVFYCHEEEWVAQILEEENGGVEH